jgi:glycerol-3-phosphate dehydrogenase
MPVTREQCALGLCRHRPLYDDGASKGAGSDARLCAEARSSRRRAPPLLSVFGGKITTFRKLAEAAMEKIAPFFPAMGKPWTSSASMPGGDFPYTEVESAHCGAVAQVFLPAPGNVRRMFRAYGTDAEKIFDGARFAADMGKSFGPLTEREVDWLKTREWARSADDILWRRSKLGLHMSKPTSRRPCCDSAHGGRTESQGHDSRRGINGSCQI